MKAKETFKKAKVATIKPKQKSTHGWDYNKMLELIQFDDEDTYLMPQFQQDAQDQNHEEDVDSDETPTTTSNSSEEYEDANDAESESSSTISNESEDPPPIPVRLPMDMNVRQNLESELQHPEVEAAVGELVDNLKEFNSRHPKPPPQASTIYKRQPRNNSKPQNYATMDKDEIESRRKENKK